MGSGLGAGQGRLLLWVCQWRAAVSRKFWELGDDAHSSGSIKREIQRESEMWVSGVAVCVQMAVLHCHVHLVCFVFRT